MDEWTELCAAWDRLAWTPFRAWLTRHGWCKTGLDEHGRWTQKEVYAKGQFVLKIDRRGHALYEWRAWRRAKGERKSYMAPCLAYHDGLLLQQKLDAVCDEYACPHPEAIELAHRFRFSHWWNHGYWQGRIMFYDYDSYGSGWWNWLKQKAEAQR